MRSMNRSLIGSSSKQLLYMLLPELEIVYKRLKASAKKRKIPFELTLTEFYNVTFPITCPILGIPLRFNRGEPKDNSYSVDRIDSSKGYSFDNIVIISYKANRLKSNATKEELSSISEFYNHQLHQ